MLFLIQGWSDYRRNLFSCLDKFYIVGTLHDEGVYLGFVRCT